MKMNLPEIKKGLESEDVRDFDKAYTTLKKSLPFVQLPSADRKYVSRALENLLHKNSKKMLINGLMLLELCLDNNLLQEDTAKDLFEYAKRKIKKTNETIYELFACKLNKHYNFAQDDLAAKYAA